MRFGHGEAIIKLTPFCEVAFHPHGKRGLGKIWRHAQAEALGLGWFATQEEINQCIWCFDGDLAQKSFLYVAEQAPQAEAYLINGMCNFRSGPNGQAQRPIHHEVAIEDMLGKPMISHDNALYWRILKTLGLAPVTQQGQLLSSLKVE